MHLDSVLRIARRDSQVAIQFGLPKTGSRDAEEVQKLLPTANLLELAFHPLGDLGDQKKPFCPGMDPVIKVESAMHRCRQCL